MISLYDFNFFWFVLEKEFGRPWHTYEAYQKVIKKQVKTLITMGADPALKVWSTFNSENVNIWSNSNALLNLISEHTLYKYIIPKKISDILLQKSSLCLPEIFF